MIYQLHFEISSLNVVLLSNGCLKCAHCSLEGGCENRVGGVRELSKGVYEYRRLFLLPFSISLDPCWDGSEAKSDACL